MIDLLIYFFIGLLLTAGGIGVIIVDNIARRPRPRYKVTIIDIKEV
jgi:hypothetical protein